MIPLIFTAAMALSAPDLATPMAGPTIVPRVLKPGEMPPAGAIVKPDPLALLRGAPALCNRYAVQALGPNGLALKKLNELPPGIEEHAVYRLVNGCPVREVVYAGQTYYLDAPTGGLTRDRHGGAIKRGDR